ncbi:MAG: sulfite exporter TauE/SafE family protein [Clostridia bacterium]|nr:sulfite exporter TauE/SafE family protein [Clostridia bacterium]MBQ8369296.1 sulfite exporter TauE/SafE family protein [Clostridia bacterium]MBQ8513640.1 sulfite exporter TauE/SafE family protein [Clostridia bacterium]
MQYLITFLEGLISFISPCMLPMLPVYISYFAGSTSGKRHTVSRAAAFVLGFTIVFTSLGLFAGVIGGFLRQYQTAVNVVTGLIVILFGLSYLEVIRIPFFKGMGSTRSVTSVFSALLFGMIYSVSLTPCVGAFLGSALMMASSGGQAAQGGLLLLTYSLGLGVPFVLSAVLIERLTTVFNAIKKHYRIINLVCGIFLILVGIAMCFGMMNALLAVFS